MKREKFTPFYKVNADDFGKDERTNRKIISAALDNQITSVSLMVNRGGLRKAVRFAKTLKSLDVGLHIDLTDNYRRFFFRYIMGKIPLEWIHEEITAQLEKFVSTGVTLNHIDSHLGVHFFPKIFRIVAEIAQELDVYVRNPIRRINWNIFNWKQCIGDNVQWLFYQVNKKYKVKSFDYMIEPKGTMEVICHV